jgi:micrococcal nuclease
VFVNEQRKYQLFFSAVLVILSLSMIGTGQVRRSISGDVVDVIDGDTITVADGDRTQWKVRLAAIDAPELGQAFGKKARKELLELVLGHPVTVTFDRSENGDLVIGVVQLESNREALVAIFPININQYLVAEGFAWYDSSFQNYQSRETKETYSRLEANARQGRKGLWAEKNPIPPWEFRGKVSGENIKGSRSADDSAQRIIVANKTSRLYYLSHCPDYDKVPALDQVSFKTASDAQAAGFTLAKNCELK